MAASTPFFTNVVGPLTGTGNISNSFQLFTLFGINQIENYTSPVPVTVNGTPIINLELGTYGNYFVNPDPNKSYQMLMMLTNICGSIATASGTGAFFPLGLTPPCSSYTQTGFYFNAGYLYFLSDLTVQTTDYIVGYQYNYSASTGGIQFFGYAPVNSQPSDFIPFQVPSFNTFNSGLPSFEIEAQSTTPGGIMYTVMPFFYNPVYPNENIPYVDTFGVYSTINEEDPNSVWALLYYTYTDGTEYNISVPTGGFPGTVSPNPSISTSEFNWGWPVGIRIDGTAGFTILGSNLSFYPTQYPFYTPVPEITGTLTFFENGGSESNETTTLADYYSFDNNAPWLGGIPYPSRIPLILESVIGAEMSTQTDTSYFMRTSSGDNRYVFGYTYKPTSEPAGSDILGNLAYYSIVYIPGVEPEDQLYNPLTEPVSGICSTGAPPLFINYTDPTHPNTIFCKDQVPSVTLPYGNILPVSGKITEYQPFVLLTQIQAKFYLDDLFYSPETAALMGFSVIDNTLKLVSAYPSNLQTFVYQIKSGVIYIRTTDTGKYLNISESNVMVLTDEPPDSGIIFSGNILYTSWYVSGAEYVYTQVPGATPYSGSLGVNGVVYNQESGTSKDAQTEMTIYLAPVPISNYSYGIVPPGVNTENYINTFIGWLTEPNLYMTSTGWTEAKKSRFTNIIDSNVGWYGGQLSNECGLNWALCPSNQFCVQSYNLAPGKSPGNNPLICSSNLYYPNTQPGPVGEPGPKSSIQGPQGIIGFRGQTGDGGAIGERGLIGLPGEASKGIKLLASPMLIFILIFGLLLFFLLIFIISFH